MNVARLLERGGFGTPTLLVGDDLYFGNDRMPLVEIALARAGGMRLVMPGEHGAELCQVNRLLRHTVHVQPPAISWRDPGLSLSP